MCIWTYTWNIILLYYLILYYNIFIPATYTAEGEGAGWVMRVTGALTASGISSQMPYYLTPSLTAVLGSVNLLHVEQLAQQVSRNCPSERPPPCQGRGRGAVSPCWVRGWGRCWANRPNTVRQRKGGVGLNGPTQCGCHRMRVNTV